MKHVMLLSVLLLGTATAQDKPMPSKSAQSGVPTDDIKHFAQVFQTVRDSYVEALTDQQIMQAGLRGLLLDIDPHSAYLNAKQAQRFEDLSDGGYAGIGIESDERDPNRIRVVAPFDGTPAQRAGLRAGDYIIAINGIPVDNEDENADPNRLRGKPGSKVVLTVERARSRLTIRVDRHPRKHRYSKRQGALAGTGLCLFPDQRLPRRYRIGVPPAMAGVTVIGR